MRPFTSLQVQRLSLAILFNLFFPAAVLFAGPSGLDIKGGVRHGYDDNIRYSPDNETSGQFSYLTLGASYLQEIKTRRISAFANIHQKLYWDHDDLNSTSQDIGLSFFQDLSKYSSLQLDEKFLHSDQATNFQDEFDQESGRFDRYTNRLTLQHKRSFSEQYQLISTYSNTVQEVNSSTVNDSLANRLGFQFESIWTPKTTGFIRYDFDHRYIDVPDNAYFHTIAPGFKRSLTRQLLWETYAGARFMKTFDGDTLTKPIFYTALSNELDERSQVMVSFLKSHEISGYTTDVFDQWRLNGALQHQLLPRLRGTANAFYGQGEYDLRDIEDRLAGLGFELGYDLNDNMGTSISYGYSNRTSSDDTREYRKNLIMLGLNFKF